ncbi:MAG: stage II sporulation protein E [Halanaerobiales bacterium]|nr:stage II sporulation protein E [Halanaerobiales bacterium]
MSVVIPVSFYRNKHASRKEKRIQGRGKIKLKAYDFLMAFLGFIMGQAVLVEGLSPFGVGFLAIFVDADYHRFILIGIGVGIGSLIARGWIGLGVTLAGILGIYIIRLWRGKVKYDAQKGIIIASMVLGFYLLKYLLTKGDIYQLLMGILEPLLILCVSWLFAEGLTELVSGERFKLTRTNVLAMLFLISGMIIGLPRILIFGVRLDYVVIQIILMSIATAGGMNHSTVLGMFLGLALALTGFYDPVMIGLYGVIGMIGGFFREYGRLAVILGMILANLIFSGLGIVKTPVEYIFLESIVSGVIFLMIPISVITNLRKYLPSTGEFLICEEDYQQEIQQQFLERLEEFSQVFRELSVTFKEVSASEEVEEDDLSYFLYIISNRVCKGCSYESYCWDQHFYQTYSQIFKLLSVLESQGKAKGEDFIRFLKGHCRNLNRLKNSIDGSLELYELHRYWNKKLKSNQTIVADQLEEIGQIIEGFSNELNLVSAKKEDMERLLKSRLEENGLRIAQCHFTGKIGEEQLNISITKEHCSGTCECRRIFQTINQMIQQPMTNYERVCGLETSQSLCYLKFCPARKYKIEVGYCNEPQAGQEISGDTIVYQYLKSGKFMLVLSDGMGIGEEASKESRSAVHLVQKIIRAGFNHDLAVRTVNAALLSRSTDESFATMDLSLIDLFNGEIELIKIGAAASFIKRGYEVNLVQGSSLPVGILQNVEPSSFKRRLQTEDFVILMTDGILDAVNTANKEEWMVRVLRQCSFERPEDMAKYIYSQAVGNGIPKDDMTVVVLKLEEEKNN